MRKKNYISHLQTIFGATKSELIFAAIILVGLFVGILIRLLSNEELQEKENRSTVSIGALYHALDSLAEVEKTTYTGTDLHNSKIPALAKGDTVVNDENSLFPFQKKKKASPTSPININTATKQELTTLPGVGKSTAEKIIAYRERHRFQTAAQIMKVKGIGKKKYSKLKQYIVVK